MSRETGSGCQPGVLGPDSGRAGNTEKTYPDTLSQKGAMALAKRLQDYWHGQGFPAVRFWTEPVEERFSKVAPTSSTASPAISCTASRPERDALLVGFAMCHKVLYGAAFDLIRLQTKLDLSDPTIIAANIGSITAYEIKSTNKVRTQSDFGGYFFDLTTAELLVAQSLGDRYRFAFVNTLTRNWIEMSLTEVFSRARKIYPKWAITF